MVSEQITPLPEAAKRCEKLHKNLDDKNQIDFLLISSIILL